jgi:hypothetical protein
MKELLLILFGFVLGLVPTWLDRKRRLRTHWAAIRAEVELCREKASSLTTDSVQSPLYRLPVMAYEASLPVLLAEGAVSETELLAVGRFYGQIQDINRGLDNAAQMLASNDADGLRREYERNLLKARRVVSGTEVNDSLYPPIKRTVDSKAKAAWWEY